MTNEITQTEWTEVVEPKAHFFDLRLREVWRYRDLLMLFVKRDFIAQYKQTVLGPLWYIIQPIFTTAIFLLLFNQIANIKTAPLNPVLFYICSISIWNYFSTCFTLTSTTFTTNAGIFGKVYFPRLVLPLSVVMSNIIKLGIQCLLLLVCILYYFFTGQQPIVGGWHYLLIPVVVLVMAALGLGLGIIISSITTKYRDFTVLMAFGVQLLMYMTPIPYPLSYIATKRPGLYAIIRFNPLTPLTESFRYAVFGVGTFDIWFFLYSIGFTIFALLIGILIFNKVERSFMDTV